ncbi:Type III restriction-modification system DNA endonuclease res [Candidatus Liberibacter solanacearum]|uniref:Type III restriction-modification system DNA endonuclease res n=3 Tax=Candidatus Liberibacter solanacearum TaxID=556287 RepID=A0A0F4VLF1_9HYPH|nr:Type III restriction-modification system DNA endonuclease res [Candidatus Liberibacter solanacearum]
MHTIRMRRWRYLLFNMATGTGKTMVMAGAILYLFKEHAYQNFIFFVHTDAIIQKTRENLLNPLSSKYLFNQNLTIEGEKITIMQVEIFPAVANKNTIYLKLSTIHKIHDELNSYKENSITYEDLQEIPLVLLGDEAHHFNAKTKAKAVKKNSSEYKELTWERTIENILALRHDNHLLEFTATIDLSNNEIFQKYKDKIVYQYDLKQFIADGYSKKVMLLEANQNDSDKMLDAILLSQYRKLIAVDNGIIDFKPIILFKSNQIAVSKSKQGEFSQLIASLTPEFVRRHLMQKKSKLSSETSIWHKVIQRYTDSDLATIIGDIQCDFNDFTLLNVNKTNLLEQSPVLLNTLEEINNPIRVIFAVAKVNEGWDVLNLYDIVRISEKASITKTSTDSEAQLIGRGARYYPFAYDGKKSFIRRFDVSLRKLSVLEQMYYHTINEPAYIQNLYKSLEQADIAIQSDGSGKIERAILKEDFKKSAVYKEGSLFLNEVEEIENRSRKWETYSLETTFPVSYQIASEESLDNFSSETNDTKNVLLELDKRFWRKAMQKIQFYTLDNLTRYFPNLSSAHDFISNEDYLGKLEIIVTIPSSLNFLTVSAKEKLRLLEEVLLRISKQIPRNYKKAKGTYRFVSKPIKDIIKDYSLYIDSSVMLNQKITVENMSSKKWYVFDNAILNKLEHQLISVLSSFIKKLEYQYKDIYLIRNDEQSIRFKLIEFEGERGFMPDFIMIMINRANNAYYQVFIEPKGNNRLLEDAWKENMLKTLNNNDRIILEENDKVRLIGIKFFATATSRYEEFIRDIENKLYDGKSLKNKSLLL